MEEFIGITIRRWRECMWCKRNIYSRERCYRLKSNKNYTICKGCHEKLTQPKVMQEDNGGID